MTTKIDVLCSKYIDGLIDVLLVLPIGYEECLATGSFQPHLKPHRQTQSDSTSGQIITLAFERYWHGLRKETVDILFLGAILRTKLRYGAVHLRRYLSSHCVSSSFWSYPFPTQRNRDPRPIISHTNCAPLPNPTLYLILDNNGTNPDVKQIG